MSEARTRNVDRGTTTKQGSSADILVGCWSLLQRPLSIIILGVVAGCLLVIGHPVSFACQPPSIVALCKALGSSQGGAFVPRISNSSVIGTSHSGKKSTRLPRPPAYIPQGNQPLARRVIIGSRPEESTFANHHEVRPLGLRRLVSAVLQL